MEELCEDISSQILIRLRAKNIAQLRCVCKRWNTLSREANFIKSHRLSINSNDKDEILLPSGNGIPFKAYSSVSPDIELINFIKFPVNFPSQLEVTIIGAANGLICFSVGYSDDCVIHVWNPSLSALLTVPPSAKNDDNNKIEDDFRVGLDPKNDDNEKIKYDFRFGYDPKNDDYKIVKHVELNKRSAELFQLEVYSMRSGCWKLISQKSHPSGVSNFCSLGRQFVCADGLDGHLHWLCYKHDLKIKTIVAFDLAAESFSEISLPDHIKVDIDEDHRLGVFGGKLCVISPVRDDCDCEVRVMDQYGSWVKNGFSHFRKGGMYTYGFTLKNKLIYYELGNGRTYLYDPDTPFKKVKPFKKKKNQNDEFSFVITYVESLVWVTPLT